VGGFAAIVPQFAPSVHVRLYWPSPPCCQGVHVHASTQLPPLLLPLLPPPVPHNPFGHGSVFAGVSPPHEAKKAPATSKSIHRIHGAYSEKRLFCNRFLSVRSSFTTQADFLYTPAMLSISTRPRTSWHLLASSFLIASTIGCGPSIHPAREAGISYSTVPSTWPANPTCLNPKTPNGFAKEVLMSSVLTVVVGGGPNPISDADWATYSPSFGNVKNSDRHLLFSSSCFARSPGTPASCEGEACKRIVELDGHTWIGLSKIEAADCVPDANHCDGMAAKPGGLLFVVTRKCHELVFNGTVRILRGPKGEKAVMHSTPNGIVETNVTLPSGWTLTEEALTEPLVVHPFGGGDECLYNIIRDHKQQGYHQIGFAGSTYP